MAKKELLLAGPMQEIPSAFILPTQVAIHTTGYASSCLTFLKRQSNVPHQLFFQSLSFSHPLLLQEMGSKKDLFNEVFEVHLILLNVFAKKQRTAQCVSHAVNRMFDGRRGGTILVFFRCIN